MVLRRLFSRQTLAVFRLLFIASMCAIAFEPHNAYATIRSGYSMKARDKIVQSSIDAAFFDRLLRPMQASTNALVKHYIKMRQKNSSRAYQLMLDQRISDIELAYENEVARVNFEYQQMRSLSKMALIDRLEDLAENVDNSLSSMQSKLEAGLDPTDERLQLKIEFERVLIASFLINHKHFVRLEFSRHLGNSFDTLSKWESPVIDLIVYGSFGALAGIVLDLGKLTPLWPEDLSLGIPPLAIASGAIIYRIVYLNALKLGLLRGKQERLLLKIVTETEDYFWTRLEKLRPEMAESREHWRSLLERYRCEIAFTTPTP